MYEDMFAFYIKLIIHMCMLLLFKIFEV